MSIDNLINHTYEFVITHQIIVIVFSYRNHESYEEICYLLKFKTLISTDIEQFNYDCKYKSISHFYIYNIMLYFSFDKLKHISINI